jgi:hypothetical protein
MLVWPFLSSWETQCPRSPRCSPNAKAMRLPVTARLLAPARHRDPGEIHTCDTVPKKDASVKLRINTEAETDRTATNVNKEDGSYV